MRAATFNARQWAESQVDTAIALDGGLMSYERAVQKIKDAIGECEFDDGPEALTDKQQAAALRALDKLAEERATANATS